MVECGVCVFPSLNTLFKKISVSISAAYGEEKKELGRQRGRIYLPTICTGQRNVSVLLVRSFLLMGFELYKLV